MKNIKIVSIFAIVGFILSLFFGLFSGSGFLKVLLTALISSIVFAVLGLALSFVFEKFLLVETSEYESQTSSAPAENTQSNLGNNVDIVIEDQELERSDSSNRYTVGENYSMLNDTDVNPKSVQTEQDTGASVNSGFVPVRNLETLTNFSGSEAVKPTEVGNADGKNGNPDELDVLPDFSGIAGKSVPVAQGSSDDDGDSLDAGFSGSISVSTYQRKNEVDTEKFQNTELIAKAISSVLSDEE